MAQGGGQSGGMGASPMGGQTQGLGSAPTGGMGGAPYMGGQAQGLGGMGMQVQQPPMGGMGGGPQVQQPPMSGYYGSPLESYGPAVMPQQGGFGPGVNNFGSPQGMMPPPSPRFAQFGGPEYEQYRPQPQGMMPPPPQPRMGDMGGQQGGQQGFGGFSQGQMGNIQQLLSQLGYGGQNPFNQNPQTQPQPQVQAPPQVQARPQTPPPPQVSRPAPAPTPAPKPQPQPRLSAAQRRAESKRLASIDFSKMGQAGQFGTQGFAQGLQDYAGQQYKDYAYNPTNQTFYKGGDKTSKGTTLDQMLQQGRAAGYKMASGGITSLRRR